jgi:hypothetical protein
MWKRGPTLPSKVVPGVVIRSEIRRAPTPTDGDPAGRQMLEHFFRDLEAAGNQRPRLQPASGRSERTRSAQAALPALGPSASGRRRVEKTRARSADSGLAQAPRNPLVPARAEVVYAVIERMLPLIGGVAGAEWLSRHERSEPVAPPDTLRDVRARLQWGTTNLRMRTAALAAAIGTGDPAGTARDGTLAHDLSAALEHALAAAEQHERRYRATWRAICSPARESADGAVTAVPLRSQPPKATLQLPGIGAADFMRKKSRGSAASACLDVWTLLKRESRAKPFAAISPEDIDRRSASRLWRADPGRVAEVTRDIYKHALAELIYAKRCVTREIGTDAALLRTQPAQVGAHRLRADLQAIEQKIVTLKQQIGHFERREYWRIDPDGTIGKALTDPFHLFQSGATARCNNKTGELWTQIFQRIGMAVPVALDRSARGRVHGVAPAKIAAPEQGAGTPPDCGAPVFAAYLGTAREASIAVHANPGQAGAAVRLRLQAAAQTHAANPARTPDDGILRNRAASENDQLARLPARRRSAGAREKEKIDPFAAWVIDDIPGPDGQPVRIDLRASGACQRENVRLEQRIWRTLRAMPPALLASPPLLQHVLKARRARRHSQRAVAEAKRLLRGAAAGAQEASIKAEP